MTELFRFDITRSSPSCVIVVISLHAPPLRHQTQMTCQLLIFLNSPVPYQCGRLGFGGRGRTERREGILGVSGWRPPALATLKSGIDKGLAHYTGVLKLPQTCDGCRMSEFESGYKSHVLDTTAGQNHAGIDPNADFQQDPRLLSHRRLKLPENSLSLESQKSLQTAFLLRFPLILAHVRS
jgi:hypothetical protein